MKLKKVLKTLFLTSTLGVIFPGLLVPGDDESASTGNDGDASNDGNGEKPNNDDDGSSNDGGSSGDSGKIIFNSQEEFDKTISRRINKAVKKAQEEKDAEIAKSKMTEIEKANLERDEAKTNAEKALKKANNMLIRAKIETEASKMNVIDVEAAYALINKEDIVIDESGKITGVESALKQLVADKTYLVGNATPKKTGDDQNNQGSNPSGKTFSMNNLIRRAAGRSD